MTTLRASQALATRQRLIDFATTEFVNDGFASVTTTSLCAAAGVTRGALYHHFANMTEVMEAVFRDAESTLVAGVLRELDGHESPRSRFLALGPATLNVLRGDRVVLRIVFVEGPTALGWARWRSLDGGRSVGLVRRLMDDLAVSGDLRPGVDPRLSAQLVLGAVNEAGMHLAATDGDDNRLDALAGQLELLCRGLLRSRDE